jgi:uncharacterized protein (DUF952 family)
VAASWKVRVQMKTLKILLCLFVLYLGSAYSAGVKLNDSIFKILTEPEWTAFKEKGVLAGAPVDIEDGFIHLSSKDQVDGVIARYYVGKRPLYIVEFSAEKFGSALHWDIAGKGEKFPHLYGRELVFKEVLHSEIRR